MLSENDCMTQKPSPLGTDLTDLSGTDESDNELFEQPGGEIQGDDDENRAIY